MSWDVRDDAWLAPVEAAPDTPVFDELDARVIAALAGAPPAEPDLPPPPPSAAFDASAAPTSYESGHFMIDPSAEVHPPDAEIEPEPAGFVIPNLARPHDDAASSESAVVDDEPASEDEDEPEPELDFVIPSLRRAEDPRPAASEHELFIPSLRRAEPVADDREAEPVAERLDVELLATHAESAAVDEVEEVHELEEIVDAPIRTGDTVVGPAPSGPTPQDLGVASPVALSHANVTDSVYDDDDETPLQPPTPGEDASPELIQRVDSAELEMLPEEEDTAVGYPPDEGAGEAWTVIPTLATPAVVGITPAEILLPLLTRVEPEPEPEEEEGVDVEPEEVEEFEVEEPPSLPPVPTAVVEEDAPEVRPPSPPPNTSERRRKGWYDDVFAEHYQFLYPPTWEETARRDAEFIHASLGLPAGATVLDVGCGDGRHALELGKLGLRVTGLDNSLALLLAAAQHKEQMGIDDQVAFLHGDMRRLPRDRQFDAVMCVGSTLGYFEEDQNRLCLDEMLERLSPTGRLLLHVFNRDFVAPQLPARSWWQGRRCMVLDEAEMNFFANRLRVHRTIIFDDGRQFEHYMFMRAFTVHDLGKTLSQMGMRVVEVSGSRDTRKRFYGAGSPDIWIVAERKT
jgi:SAM-dependent methyltransferase